MFFRLLLIVCICCAVATAALGQPAGDRQISLAIRSSTQNPLPFASVSLLQSDSSLVYSLVADSAGKVSFRQLTAGQYLCRVTASAHQQQYSALIDLREQRSADLVIGLVPVAGVLQGVTVASRKPLVQFYPDKTVVNVEASITNTGATVMEVLEKSPGVTVDRDGNVSLKGRAGVQIMIDGKLTQLSGPDLQNLLSGMSAAQVETIELMDNPPAKYDAAGNAGIINIKTKKIKQKGFNGSVSIAYGQGFYPKNNNSVNLNYRTGKLNFFLNYNLNTGKFFMDMYALRTYYNDNGSVSSLLEQPYNTRTKAFTQTIKTGVDYYISQKTTMGVAFTGLYLTRDNKGTATAHWMDQSGNTDSVINTTNHNTARMQQGGFNFNARHVFDAARELSADFDLIGYDIHSKQYFENTLQVPGSTPEATKGDIPSDIGILTGKLDYSQRFGNLLWEAGWKSSRVKTDNQAQYYYLYNDVWEDDLGKSNHFIYTESIHALYSSVDMKAGKWQLQGGLRYEHTGYQARQLGNAMVKDSSFNRNYNSLFPTAFVTYAVDSLNSLTLRAGRRIDRPGFQKLNPFVFIINKYTFQKGNPYFLPQYTWNVELSHMFKDILSTTVSYNLTKDYFSQIFISDTATGMIVYTEGNVGRMQNFGVSVNLQLPVTKWWSLSAQGTLNHKIIEGTLWREYKAKITQANFSVNNQFRFKKGWAAELTGFYITKSQNDLQEVLDPTGQVSVGVSKQVLKNKGTFRLTGRDIFYTQAMQGWTDFQNTLEYFKLVRDTRVVTLSFTYRFGKSIKAPARRSSGGAGDEIERVGTVN